MPKILLVKTSSMGDVIHNLPVVADIRARFPDAEIDWVVEESFAAIPRMHPGVGEVLPVALRRWRKALFARETRAEMRAFALRLRRRSYDFVIDTQGLIKSAILARLARGVRCGMDRSSAREPLSALFYDRAFPVDKNRHAVERNRLLAAKALGYGLEMPLHYGLSAPSLALPWLPTAPFVVLLHATSRAEKLWPERNWLALARTLNDRGFACVLPWGSEEERLRSRRLADQMASAVVCPALSLFEAAALLARAAGAAGVDTGLIHLAAALNVPTVAIYCATEPGLTGVYTPGPAANLGGPGAPPDPAAVIAALAGVMGR
jgi:heptosyltransferase-1